MRDEKIIILAKQYQNEMSSKLQELGYHNISIFDDSKNLISQLEKLNFDIALIELPLDKDFNGIEASFHIQDFYEKPVLFITESSISKKLLKKALINYDFEYLKKPFLKEELYANIRLCLQKNQSKKELLKKEQLLNITLSNIGSGVIVLDTKGKVFYLNNMAQALTGFSEKEDLSKHINDIFITQNEKNEELIDFPSLTNNNTLETEVVAVLNNALLKNLKNEDKIPIDINTAPLKDEKNRILGAIIIFRNISQRIKMEKKLRLSLSEKELLLKEIHHRVKNSLQLTSSLLSIQSSEITDKTALQALKKSQDRIKTIALVHEKLYQSQNYKNIDIKKYLEDLLEYLKDSFDFKTHSITLVTNIESFSLKTKNVINCGLIINELILNSLEHAFKKDQKDKKIQVSFYKTSENHYTLKVQDNGKGFPADFSTKDTLSLGFELILQLVRQMKGEYNVSSKKGAEIKISFPAS